MIVRASIAAFALLLVGPPQGQGQQPQVSGVRVSSGTGNTQGGAFSASVSAESAGGSMSGGGFSVSLNASAAPTLLNIDRIAVIGFLDRVTLEMTDVPALAQNARVTVFRARNQPSGFTPIPTRSAPSPNSTQQAPLRLEIDENVTPGVRYFYMAQAAEVDPQGNVVGSPGPFSRIVQAIPLSSAKRAALPEDVTGDDEVDGVDLLEVAYRLGVPNQPNEPFFLPSADVNGDNDINDADLRQTAGRLGSNAR